MTAYQRPAPSQAARPAAAPGAGPRALPQLVRCGRAICGQLEQAERREW